MKILRKYSHVKPAAARSAGLTHVWDPRLRRGPLSDKGLHLFLLLLLLSFLIQEVLQEEWLLLQEQRPVLALVLVLALGADGLALGGGPRVWGLGLGVK